MSTVVIARLLGVSTSYVSNMLKKARMTQDDRDLVVGTTDTASEGRAEARSEAGVDEGAEAASLTGVWAVDPGSWPEGHLPFRKGSMVSPSSGATPPLGAMIPEHSS